MDNSPNITLAAQIMYSGWYPWQVGYSRWENFELVIKKAIMPCENAGGNVEDHFRDVTKMIKIAKMQREIQYIKEWLKSVIEEEESVKHVKEL